MVRAGLAHRIASSVIGCVGILGAPTGSVAAATEMWHEAQSVWMADGVASLRRVHVGTHLPDIAVGGVVAFDVRILVGYPAAFSDPGVVRRLEVVLGEAGPQRVFELDWRPERPLDSRTVAVALDTRDLADGWHELEVRTSVDIPSGFTQGVLLKASVRTKNGNDPSDRDFLGPRSLSWVLNPDNRGAGVVMTSLVTMPTVPLPPVWPSQWYVHQGSLSSPLTGPPQLTCVTPDTLTTFTVAVDPDVMAGDAGQIQVNRWPVLEPVFETMLSISPGRQVVQGETTLDGASCRLTSGLAFEVTGEPQQNPPAPSPGPVSPALQYFTTLSQRPDRYVAYSLRSQAELDTHVHGQPPSRDITYDPSVDAAKVVWPSGSNTQQVRLPLDWSPTSNETLLITWDARFNEDFQANRGAVSTSKTFQLSSANDQLWLEVRNRYSQCSLPCISRIDVRPYGALGPGASRGSADRLEPMEGTFSVRRGVWTRFWVLYERKAGDWDEFSFWVADENTGPVRLHDNVRLDWTRGGIGKLWLEYNSSQTNNGVMTGHVRNVVALEGLSETQVAGLLERPIK